MTPELTKQLRSLLVRTSILQVVSVVLLFLVPIAANNSKDDDLADVLAKSVRQSIIIGDFRSAITALGEHTPQKFSNIEYISNNKGFLLPVGLKQNSLEKFFERQYKIQIDLSGDKNNGEVIGTLVFRQSQIANFLIPLIIGILIFLASYPLYQRSKRKLASRYELDLRLKRDSEIAKTTQMLAHDVRKPFSKLLSTLNVVSGCSTIEEAQTVSKKMYSQIAFDYEKVNGMLKDIVEINGKVELILEETSPSSLVELAINQVFSTDEKSEASFIYDFNHTTNALVSSDKMLRVIENILRNAVEATQGNTTITFSTYIVKVKRQHFIKFEIKNTGSFIKETDLNLIFSDGYSQNKQNGTGLGLAIAQKFIEAHGGTIECESSEEENWVEFSFTAPTGKTRSSESDYSLLPQTSQDIHMKWSNEALRTQSIHEAVGLTDLEKSFRSLIEMEGECRILIIDDEFIYQRSLQHQLGKNQEISKYLRISTASSSAMAIAMAAKTLPHIIICDIELGQHSKNGFETVKKIRDLGIRSHICIHSSRERSDVIERVTSCGADDFIPKPMPYEHIIGHLVIALTKAKLHTQTELNEISIIDDDESMLFLWQHTVKDAKVNTFISPESFLSKIEEDPNFLERQYAIVSDFYFKERDKMNGTDFALLLKQEFNRDVVLCSDASELPISDRKAFQWVITKEPIGMKKLKSIIEC